MNRSPHLVSYANVDEAIKKANRDTASETVRTLLIYGYILEPPSGDNEGIVYSQTTFILIFNMINMIYFALTNI